MTANFQRLEAFIRAGLVWVYLYGATLLIISAALGEDLRPYFADSATAHAVSFLFMVATTLPLFVLLRRRFELPGTLAPKSGTDAMVRRIYTLTVLAIPVASFLVSVDRYTPVALLDLPRWEPYLASLAAIASIAVLEELQYRLALMGILLRAQIPAAVVVLLQAAIFVLAHKRQAFVSPDALLKYAAGAVTLGALYLASRSLMAPIALHFSVNLLLAQTAPASYWIGPRLVDAVNLDWFRVCTWGFVVMGAALLSWRVHGRWGHLRLHRWPRRSVRILQSP